MMISGVCDGSNSELNVKETTELKPGNNNKSNLDESKTPEHEQQITVADAENTSENTVENNNNLSIRAESFRKSLLSNKGVIVDAVVLCMDGSIQQIGYDTTIELKHINCLLNGLPTIVGEFEDLNVVIIQSLNESKTKLANKKNCHTLPHPFCNKAFFGDLFLYRFDKDGKYKNFTKAEYIDYVKRMNEKTSNQPKEHISHKAAGKKSVAFEIETRLTWDTLQTEVQKMVQSEFIKKFNCKPTNDELAQSVNATLDDLINKLLDNNNRMNDPDFKCNEMDNFLTEENKQNIINHIRNILKEKINLVCDQTLIDAFIGLKKKLLKIQQKKEKENKKTDLIEIDLDLKEWNKQKKEVLNICRKMGKNDGQILASKIAETFYEINGENPNLEQLTNIFRKIKHTLAEEANEEDIKQKNSADLLEYAQKIVRKDLIIKAKQSFLIRNGCEPNVTELKEEVTKLALHLFVYNNNINDDNNNEQHESDEDYDPENKRDKALEKSDKIETHIFEVQEFKNEENKKENKKEKKTKILVTPSKKKQNAVSYEVYFDDEQEINDAVNVSKAIMWFKRFNNRDPTNEELTRIENFVKCENNNNGVMMGNINRKENSAKFNVYLTDDTNQHQMIEKRVSKAMIWFEKFNNRLPTDEEKQNIIKFIKSDMDDNDMVDID